VHNSDSDLRDKYVRYQQLKNPIIYPFKNSRSYNNIFEVLFMSTVIGWTLPRQQLQRMSRCCNLVNALTDLLLMYTRSIVSGRYCSLVISTPPDYYCSNIVLSSVCVDVSVMMMYTV